MGFFISDNIRNQNISIANKIICCFVLGFWGCGVTSENGTLPCDQIEGVNPDNVTIARAESDFMNIRSLKTYDKFVSKYPELADKFLNVNQIPRQKNADRIIKLTKDPYFDTLYHEALEDYKNLKPLKEAISIGFYNLKKLDPQWTPPVIQTMITGFANGCDLAYENNKLLIGIDWFLETDAKYRVPDQPDFILNRYTPTHLPSAIMLLFSNLYNKIDQKDDTLLASMIEFGKAYEFVKQMIPCTPDRIIIGYSKKEMIDVNGNQQTIWTHFLDNELLFSKSLDYKRTYVFEAPSVQEIDNACPGRIGRWLGWQIVKFYLKKSHSSLKDLMDNTDYRQIFETANYRPQPDTN